MSRTSFRRTGIWREEENRLKRANLNNIIVDAFEAARIAIEGENDNVGPFEHAIKIMKTASGQIQAKGDLGILIYNETYLT